MNFLLDENDEPNPFSDVFACLLTAHTSKESMERKEASSWRTEGASERGGEATAPAKDKRKREDKRSSGASERKRRVSRRWHNWTHATPNHLRKDIIT